MNKEQILFDAIAKPIKVFYSDVPATGSSELNYVHKEILFLLDEACSYYGLSKNHLTFYLSHEHITDVRTDVWYDTGGVRVPCFSGLYVLDAEENAQALIDTTICRLYPGAIYLWEAGKQIRYSHENTAMLGFNVAPTSMLKNQDMTLWKEL